MGVEGGVGRSPPAVMELGGGICFRPWEIYICGDHVPSFMGTRGTLPRNVGRNGPHVENQPLDEGNPCAMSFDHGGWFRGKPQFVRSNTQF